MNTVPANMLALQRLYEWEKTARDRIALTQPMGGGVVKDLTWGEVADQVRRMAAHLKAQGWEPGSKVAILSKNCAWWLMSDLAIWMAGCAPSAPWPSWRCSPWQALQGHRSPVSARSSASMTAFTCRKPPRVGGV